MLGKNKNTNYTDDARTKVNTMIGEGTIFDGDLTSPEIAGNITAGSLVIDEGACFDGRCTMTAAATSSYTRLDSGEI